MTYFLLKFIHIAAAIIWIGGVFTLSILNLRLVQKKERSALLTLGEQSKFFGKTVIGPSAAITLIAGMAMVALVWQSAPLWVVWGFSAVLVSMLLGGFFMNRLGNKLTRLAASSDSTDVELQATHRRMALLTGINILVLFSAVWVMVFKPTL